VTELPLFPDPPPPGPETRCDDCGRRIWASDAIRAGPDGRRYGSRCRRRHRRTRIVIADRPAWAVPGQTEIPMPDQEEPCP
jgi:hypothetical protein